MKAANAWKAAIKRALTAGLFLLPVLGLGQPLAAVPYATEQVIQAGDSDAMIAEKAAKVLPRPKQTQWFRMERTFFIHFGPNTFNHVEWGSGMEDASLFNPTELDAEQWVFAVKEAGGRMIVPVCKHHDGFCLWPTRYETHSVAASPWKDGTGDVIREVSDAARKHGIKLGIYLSPADLYQLPDHNPDNPNPYYGNGSRPRTSVIPTDPESFQSDPARGRIPPPGSPTFTYEVDDYNRYYLNQLYELLTEYGPIHQINIDGANPKPGYKQTYAYDAWYDLINTLQPDMVITVKGPDGRWVGNEGGVGRTTEWSVIPLPEAPEDHDWPDRTGGDLGSRSKLTAGSHLWWYPAEVNMPILHGWFWAPGKACRTATDLVNTYYQSVGRNGIWLLNLSPDDRGLIPDDQLDNLRLSTRVLTETFAKNLAAGGNSSADGSNAVHSPSLAMDGDLDTWWEAAPGKTTAEVVLELPAPVEFDVVSLQEAVDHRGQRIESFDIAAWDGAKWTGVDTTEERTTIGYKRLMRTKSPVSTDRVRIRIKESRMEPTIAEVGLFKQAELMRPPAILGRDSSKTFAGMAPIGWKVVAVDSEETALADNSAARAIDGDSSTIWHSRWDSDLQLPHAISIDMGQTHRIGALAYLPRQDGMPNGVVGKYRFETSTDGVNWVVRIESGSFGNIRNNPVLQEVRFDPVDARYFRFTALQDLTGNGWTSAAEISVVPVDAKP